MSNQRSDVNESRVYKRLSNQNLDIPDRFLKNSANSTSKKVQSNDPNVEGNYNLIWENGRLIDNSSSQHFILDMPVKRG